MAQLGFIDIRLADGSDAELPAGLLGFTPVNSEGSAAAATPIVIDTGFAPPPGHSAALLVVVDVNDAATPASANNTDAVSVKNAAGTLTVSGTPTNLAKTGTAGLIAGAFAVSYSVSANNTLVVTVTPPVAYAAPLTAAVQMQAVVA